MSSSHDRPSSPDELSPHDQELPTDAHPDVDDARWCALVTAGDRAAFTEMFRAYADRLSAFAFSFVGSREVAEELVQDLFFAIWQRRETWVVHGTLKTYLYTGIRNRALDQLRRRQRFHRVKQQALRSDLSLATGGPGPTAQRALEQEELAAEMRRAVDELPEQQRMVVRLRWLDQLSHPEIARVLSISVRTSENHMARAMARLRQVLAVYRG